MTALGGASRLDTLQRLLAGLYDSPVTVARVERLEPWAVARVWLDATPALPPSVVVKWVPDGERDARTAAWRLRTECAALRFLAEDVGVRLAPRVIAEHAGDRFVVLEDLAPRVALDRLLRRDGAAAHRERLAAFAEARGALSAATAGQAAGYHARRELAGLDAAADRAARLAALRGSAVEQASALDVALDGRSLAELDRALGLLADPGPFLALSNGDAEANNVLLHATGPARARLIDFEFAGYTHALTDAVCLYVPGPAWLTVGDPAATGLADAYRRALARGIPAAEDDRRYGEGLAAACAAWALRRLQRFAALDARAPGDHSRLQLVATLDATARTAGTHQALPHLTGWFGRATELLRRRWPDADRDLADPAAFPPYAVRR
ncbi:aminoglycoside phosphotransferase family protein [Actinacidiphila bryophytorum]|uniref:aminoglycoside phosphotransferase family protein n=1 Tax=Actinacidiphila bryophytorum TaxID=1436133 RepID=UPI002176AD81|nr:aminoglycoside phosphotransferase family protein [Actinacidiphila bryophytorum]UWE10506.1 aminoglycoside phosphotransferase family protein [Actinacidiphila bryophytorum]